MAQQVEESGPAERMPSEATSPENSIAEDASDNEELPSFGDSSEGYLDIPISHRGTITNLGFFDGATLSDLFKKCESSFGIPQDNIKLFVPRGPMLRAPLKEPDLPLAQFEGKTLKLMGSSAAQIKAVTDLSAMSATRSQRAAAAHRQQQQQQRKPARRSLASADDLKYTFLQIRPLSFLPRPDKSEKLLRRLKDDRGIREVMKKHKFTVGLLTEMEPLSNTQASHEGTARTLGLNRNGGEVIELRLWTDAYDGYRDYRTIRRTLCHELAHNVHGPHDRNFWDLCHQIEREVEAADWSAGHTVGGGSGGQQPVFGRHDEDEDEHQDDGGWTGGEFVLGGSSAQAGLSRREILANAALERQKKEDKAERRAEDGWRPCQRHQRGDSVE
ncbi:Ubiquitin and WLM domain-containing protein [Escovopsis weberi]|uniref:Ubiquitin and WLM domain-containing protein n=1 Tax=Escovopsis weberi TaxID=150374 RepID=A0A0M9VX95_ESCWE|nr:Ubiquitin and WLM domain-containing protein [Escovopsis weberi]